MLVLSSCTNRLSFPFVPGDSAAETADLKDVHDELVKKLRAYAKMQVASKLRAVWRFDLELEWGDIKKKTAEALLDTLEKEFETRPLDCRDYGAKLLDQLVTVKTVRGMLDLMAVKFNNKVRIIVVSRVSTVSLNPVLTAVCSCACHVCRI
jgi:hypothetical protein